MVYKLSFDCLSSCWWYNESMRRRLMTDTLLQYNAISQHQDFEKQQSIWNSADDMLSKGGEEYMLQLSKQIARKQASIRKAETDVLLLSELQRRLGRVLNLLPNTNDKKLRENQIYNALTYYLYGNTVEAVRYAKAAGKKPDSFVVRLMYGAKIRKSMIQLRWLFAFIDEKNCRQRVQERTNNQDFCAAVDMFLNVRQPKNSAVEFLNRKMFNDYKSLRELNKLKNSATHSLNVQNAEISHKNMAFVGKLSAQEVAALVRMAPASYA